MYVHNCKGLTEGARGRAPGPSTGSHLTTILKVRESGNRSGFRLCRISCDQNLCVKNAVIKTSPMFSFRGIASPRGAREGSRSDLSQ